MSNLKPKPET